MVLKFLSLGIRCQHATKKWNLLSTTNPKRVAVILSLTPTLSIIKKTDWVYHFKLQARVEISLKLVREYLL